jgi:outer membrane protein assembly factor BamB
LQAGAPAGANPNDVRWLAVLPAPPTTEPILTPTALPPDEFPFYRVRRGNNATWPVLPKPTLQTDWPNPFQATGPMSSAVLVMDGYVMAGSDDGHIYALDRTFGNQQRSFSTNQRISAGPVAQDRLLYFVTQNGTSYALNHDLQQIWQSTVNGTPFTPLYQAGNRLFVGVQESSDNVRRLMRLDRVNGGTLFPERYQFTDGQPLAALAVGNQLLYLGDPGLRAVDLNKLTLVWQQDGVGRLTAPPVYVTNGTQALAELYVADEQNRLHLVDANTGRILWSADVGGRITGLAVGPDAIYGSGPGFLLAWPRRNGNQLWRANVQGEARGGPIVGPNQILVVTDIGNLLMFDLNGINIGSAALPGGVQVPVGAAPAVSGLYIFVPGSDGKVHAFRGQQ